MKGGVIRKQRFRIVTQHINFTLRIEVEEIRQSLRWSIVYACFDYKGGHSGCAPTILEAIPDFHVTAGHLLGLVESELHVFVPV